MKWQESMRGGRACHYSIDSVSYIRSYSIYVTVNPAAGSDCNICMFMEDTRVKCIEKTHHIGGFWNFDLNNPRSGDCDWITYVRMSEGTFSRNTELAKYQQYVVSDIAYVQSSQCCSSMYLRST